jgi:hypothetical protein
VQRVLRLQALTAKQEQELQARVARERNARQQIDAMQHELQLTVERERAARARERAAGEKAALLEVRGAASVVH